MPPGRVLRVAPETPKLSRIELEVPSEMASSYRVPGQILSFPGTTGPVHLALVSDPGARTWELLASADARQELRLDPGQPLDLPKPAGPGFDPGAAEGRDVLLFGVGSALGPLRPLVRALVNGRSNHGWIRLYAGVHTPADMPFRDELDAWRRERIDVFMSHGKPWVQDVFLSDPPDVDDAVAYVCGMDAMVKSVQETLERVGLPAERVYRNW